jgi:alpha-beta hydrolase superfamily lysophospholipase
LYATTNDSHAATLNPLIETHGVESSIDRDASGVRSDDDAREMEFPGETSAWIATRERSSATTDSGPFYTSERRGGVERRQLALKGVEGVY